MGGAIINDMARGGDLAWPPGTTQYPWVALEGLVPAAVILDRAGYPAFAVADRAVLRAVRYLWDLQLATQSGRWFQERRSSEILQLVNVAYGARFPVDLPAGAGRTVGYTDWTHGQSSRDDGAAQRPWGATSGARRPKLPARSLG